MSKFTHNPVNSVFLRLRDITTSAVLLVCWFETNRRDSRCASQSLHEVSFNENGVSLCFGVSCTPELYSLDGPRLRTRLRRPYNSWARDVSRRRRDGSALVGLCRQRARCWLHNFVGSSAVGPC